MKKARLTFIEISIAIAAPFQTLFFPPCGKLRASDQASASG